jgi:signal transduction histidine kinase
MAAAPMNRPRSVSLRWVLILPFILQIALAVGVVGFLSYKNGEKAIENLAQKLETEVGNRVDNHLDNYLALPHQINHLNRDAIDQGTININDLDRSSRYFWKQSQVFKQLSYIGYALPNDASAGAGRWLKGYDLVATVHPPGQSRDFSYNTNDQGQRVGLVHTGEYSSVQDVWYRETVAAGKPIWSRIYSVAGTAEDDNYIAASANMPLYDRNQKLLGVLGVDLLLSDIHAYLRQILPTPTSQIFIVERSGQLIASSNDVSIVSTSGNQKERWNMFNSPDQKIQAIGGKLQSQFQSLTNIQSNQSLQMTIAAQPHYVQVLPWQDEYGLDWLVVVAIPKSDFMGQMQANARTTVILCLGALGVASLVGILTSRLITRPIWALNRASAAIADGNLEQRVMSNWIVELDSVGDSFNSMAVQLESSFSALEETNAELEARVSLRTQELRENNTQLNDALQTLQQTQTQMIQAEKMSALGQLVAGVAHEINNPIGCIVGNVKMAESYIQDLWRAIELYRQQCPEVVDAAIATDLENLDLEFIRADLPKMIRAMKDGSERITMISRSLRNFSRADNDVKQLFNVHEGLNSTVLILRHRLKANTERPTINVVMDYADDLPAISCYPGQLNQVFMNILANAIDALEESNQGKDYEMIVENPNQITIQTQRMGEVVMITIADNGPGLTADVQARIFDHLFTTKAVGKGTGLGMAIAQQIVAEKHGGTIVVNSEVGQGAAFVVTLPLT